MRENGLATGFMASRDAWKQAGALARMALLPDYSRTARPVREIAQQYFADDVINWVLIVIIEIVPKSIDGSFS